ncbi:putative repeat protein (TIGR03847 family) [Kutzneria viridogrisea]|uniref:Repeat protein (TIGR03847 family) n=1 Tax=Kutzneria viridogrisea TaxID=47990 RepID=A0ABR6BCQ9_9PSEU|nr:putative repeat protein (TIGR03847 family) [Kutzneria viridogrisea]
MARVIHVFRQPERFVAGTVGQPGERTFYLQAAQEGRLVSVVLEKAQVAVLAERIGSLLEEVARRFGAEVPETTPEEELDTEPLSVPVEEEFRVGTMGLGWDAESEAVVVELLAATEEEVDEAVVLDDTEEGPDAVRVFLSPVEARAFASRADLVVNAGRKPCPLCEEPLDPAGHVCPRQNGYRRTTPLAEN